MERLVPQVLNRAVYAYEDGKVEYVDAKKVVVKGKSGKSEFLLEKFARTSQSTCFSQTPKVTVGEKIKKSQVIIDGPACENGELALGQNLRIAYMAFNGLGYEDAIVISEKLL